jgi:hypothetical protein
MVYTQEQLMKAVREAGREGQPFSAGEVRALLGLKSRDKRELKRFRGRLRECCQGLGAGIEKLGPNTFRLTASALPPSQATASLRASASPKAAAAVAAPRSALIDRVGITPRTAAEPTQRTAAVKASAPKPQAQLELPASDDSHSTGLGSRVSAWLNRVRGRNSAATALSRLALDLQPSSSHFQYQWVDGDLRVKVSGLGRRQRSADE